MSMPKSVGSGIRFDVADTIDGLANTNFSSDSAAAKVTTASWAPRMRRAGRPTMMPAAVAISAASSREIGNGMFVPNLDRAMPAMPPNAAWAREICPTMPVSTTRESAMRATARLVMTPKR